jgi:hypothetical protein
LKAGAHLLAKEDLQLSFSGMNREAEADRHRISIDWNKSEFRNYEKNLCARYRLGSGAKAPLCFSATILVAD